MVTKNTRRHKKRQSQQAAWSQLERQPIAASGAWTADNTFTAKLCFYETPYVVTLTLTFSGDELRVDAETNVGFGPTRQPQRIGKTE